MKFVFTTGKRLDSRLIYAEDKQLYRIRSKEASYTQNMYAIDLLAKLGSSSTKTHAMGFRISINITTQMTRNRNFLRSIQKEG